MGRKRTPQSQKQDQDRGRTEAERSRDHENRERQIDEALSESFPCSDPPVTSSPGHLAPETSPDLAAPDPAP